MTGLSQSKFAKKYHLSVRTLQRWEQWGSFMKKKVLLAVPLVVLSLVGCSPKYYTDEF
jgi:hypothetical protein